jgi:hypothetical protein
LRTVKPPGSISRPATLIVPSLSVGDARRSTAFTRATSSGSSNGLVM